MSPDLKFWDASFTQIKVNVKNCIFNNIDATLTNCNILDSLFENVRLAKTDNKSVTTITNSHLRDSIIDGYWLELEKGYIFARNIFNNVTKNINRNSDTTILLESLDITDSLSDFASPVVKANPNSGLYNIDLNISLITNKPSTIYYTLDGTIPTTASPV